jgi:cephalosporin-C deacetylase-like acetyl esterase
MRVAILLFCSAVLQAQAPPSSWYSGAFMPDPMRRHQMHSWVTANIPPLPRYASLDEWKRERGALRQRLLRLLGIDDILANHKLEVVHKGTLDRDGYTIEKITYESYPGMAVPALVWVPKNLSGKAPAAVSISGHLYCGSKAGAYVQARSYNLVRRGFIVISYDYFGCSERARLDPCKEWPGVDHTNSLFSYTNRSPLGVEVLDGIRAIDYLYSRDDVDRTRLAFTGESGGGNNTQWVAALDERVTLAVPVSAATAYEYWIKSDHAFDWHARPTGVRAVADIGTLYALTAPRPLLVINGHPELSDFALPYALESVEYGKHVYRLYGAEERIGFIESPTPHGYQTDKRIDLYRWLNRWYFNGAMPHGDEELAYEAEPIENFVVGVPEGNPTIPGLARQWIEDLLVDIALPATADAAREFQTRKRQQLETLLARKNPAAMPSVTLRYQDVLVHGPYRAERLQLGVERDLWIPAVFARKEGRDKYKTVLIVQKYRGWNPAAQALLDRGYALLTLDVRGTGELDWGGGTTTNWAQLMGRPPIGMWAEDVSKATTYLLGRDDVESVAVMGYGLFGKVALYAAALDPRIAAAAVSIDSLSYRRDATAGLAHAYADVPHILTWGDTPQLAALVAPRPLLILRAGLTDTSLESGTYFSPSPRVQPLEKWVSDQELSATFDWTRQFYGRLGGEPQFQTGWHDEAAWFAEHF